MLHILLSKCISSVQLCLSCWTCGQENWGNAARFFLQLVSSIPTPPPPPPPPHCLFFNSIFRPNFLFAFFGCFFFFLYCTHCNYVPGFHGLLFLFHILNVVYANCGIKLVESASICVFLFVCVVYFCVCCFCFCYEYIFCLDLSQPFCV